MKRLYHILGLGFIGVILLTLAVFHFQLDLRYMGIQAQTSSENLASASESSNPIVEKAEKYVPLPIKILILGDMMFDRGVRSQINSKGFEYVFGSATTTFSEYDLVIANLEGPITSSASKTVLENNTAIPGFQFTFPLGTARALKDAGIDMVSLANNHTANFGQAGLVETRSLLSEAGVQYFGSPENNTLISTSTCLEILQTPTSRQTRLSSHIKSLRNTKSSDQTKSDDAFCIGFIGWHEFGEKNYQLILDEIKNLRPQVDYLVVFPHWGEEYKKEPHIEQIRLAREWTDAGADTVIGSHPHVVQKISQRTTTDGRVTPIFYSLGNFIFDQYFSFDTTHGVAVEVEFPFTQSKVAQSATYKILPFSSTGSKVSIPNASSTARIFKDIEKVSGTSTWDWLKK